MRKTSKSETAVQHQAKSTGAPHRENARLNSQCIVCGASNPRGLQLRFEDLPDGASAEWTPTGEWESFQGTIHGGIIGTVLDEAMSKAIIARNCEAYTAELRVRFRALIAPGDHLYVRGWIVERRNRLIKAEASILSADGKELAHGWGAFLVPR